MILVNAYFILMYAVLLLIWGYVFDRYGMRKMIRGVLWATLILSYPLMCLIESQSWWGLMIAQGMFASLAAGIGPIQAWIQSLFPPHRRYQHVSTAYAIGKCGSTLLLAGSVLLFEYDGRISSLSLLLIGLAMMTLGAFKIKPRVLGLVRAGVEA
jgi:MFS family permease